MLENIVGAYLIGTELKLTVALVLIVGVLVVKPAGLFGRVIVQGLTPSAITPSPDAPRRWRRAGQRRRARRRRAGP